MMSSVLRSLQLPWLALLLVLLLSCVKLSEVEGRHTTKHLLDTDWGYIKESGNYTCDELTRWLGTEKHYSNKNREVLFGLNEGDTACKKQPVLLLHDVKFGRGASKGGDVSYFRSTSSSLTCKQKDTHVVAYLSNFSINNNFSHFLHGLLKLFCALIDAQWIVWDNGTEKFVQAVDYTIWLDEYFKLDDAKLKWLGAMGGRIFHLGKQLPVGNCAAAQELIYGSGCVKLLPPEKWFGYPGCRAGDMLPAFGDYMRQQFKAPSVKDLFLIDRDSDNVMEKRKERLSHSAVKGNDGDGIRVAFAVRDTTAETGKRVISNLDITQVLLQQTQHIRTKTENVTFEHFDVPSTVKYMASVHIFVSVHGAGMTNMFFMNPGSAVVEIIPYPLCNCKSPDYFYGVGGYYHGSSVAQNIRHYPYCVEAKDVTWHKKPDDIHEGSRCSWKHLHLVESVRLDTTRFVSLMRSVERDLIQAGTVILTQPIIRMSPHANG